MRETSDHAAAIVLSSLMHGRVEGADNSRSRALMKCKNKPEVSGGLKDSPSENPHVQPLPSLTSLFRGMNPDSHDTRIPLVHREVPYHYEKLQPLKHVSGAKDCPGLYSQSPYNSLEQLPQDYHRDDCRDNLYQQRRNYNIHLIPVILPNFQNELVHEHWQPFQTFDEKISSHKLIQSQRAQTQRVQTQHVQHDVNHSELNTYNQRSSSSFSDAPLNIQSKLDDPNRPIRRRTIPSFRQEGLVEYDQVTRSEASQCDKELQRMPFTGYLRNDQVAENNYRSRCIEEKTLPANSRQYYLASESFNRIPSEWHSPPIFMHTISPEASNAQSPSYPFHTRKSNKITPQKDDMFSDLLAMIPVVRPQSLQKNRSQKALHTKRIGRVGRLVAKETDSKWRKSEALKRRRVQGRFVKQPPAFLPITFLQT